MSRYSITFVIFLSKPESHHEEDIGHIKMVGNPIERLPANLHKSQGHESQERLRNCLRLKETRRLGNWVKYVIIQWAIF